MKKYLFVLFLAVFFLFPAFSQDIDEVADNISQVEAVNAELKNKNYDRGVELINSLERSGEVADTVSFIIDSIMLQFVNIHNEAFGMERVKSSLAMPSFSLSGRFNFGAGTVFKFLLSLFVVIYALVFAIHTVTKPNVQYSELLDTARRIVICFFIFAIMPYLPTMLIKLSFAFAELVTGSAGWEYGATHMEYSTPVHMTKTTGFMLLASGGAAALTSLLEFSVGFIANVGITLSSLSWISMAVFGIFMGGLLVSFVVAIQFRIRCLDLYITNFLMAVVLPGAILKGWGNDQFLGYDTGTLIKYYILNTFEIFIGATMILIVNGVFVVLTRNMIEAGISATEAGIIRMGVQYIAQPLLLLILMPVSSDILRNLTGSITGVSDANGSVSSATAQTMRAVKTAAAGYGVRQAISSFNSQHGASGASASNTGSTMSEKVSQMSQNMKWANLGGNGTGPISGS